MANNLAEFSLGGTDQANQTLLHTSGVALAGGIQIGVGDGSDTGLVVGSNWIGIQGLSARASLTFTGNTDRTFTLPSGGGGLVSGTGEGVDPLPFKASLGDTVKFTSAVASNATTVAEAIAELSVTPLAGAIYRFEYLLLAQTTSTGTGLALDLLAPANAASLVGQATQARTANVRNERVWAQSFSASPAALSDFGLEADNQDSLITVTGLLVMGPNATGDLTLSLRATSTNATVSIRPGSVLTLTRLN